MRPKHRRLKNSQRTTNSAVGARNNTINRKKNLKLHNGSITSNNLSISTFGGRKSKRSHSPIKKFDPDATSPEKISKSVKSPSGNNLPVYLKGEFLAIRNDSGSFFICTALQNVYWKSSNFILQWLNNRSSPDVFETDYVDRTDVQAILREVQLEKTGKNQFQLPESEKKKILKSLNDSVNAEKGLPISLSDEDEVTDEEKEVNKRKKITKATQKRKSSTAVQTLAATAKLKRKSDSNKRKKDDSADSKSPSKRNKVSKTKPPKPEKLRNAKFPKNTDIKILEKDPTFCSHEVISPISILADTKITLKAVKMKKYQLLKDAIANVDRVAQISLHRSCYCSDNAFKEAMINEDYKALKIMFDYIHVKDAKRRVTIPYSNVPTSDTGTMDYRMLGHATAPISAARGSREGNAAFTKGDTNCGSKYDLLKKAMKKGLSYKTLLILLNEGGHIEHPNKEKMYENIYHVVRHGHVSLAKKLIEEATSRNGFGFTDVYSKALENNPKFENVRAASVNKKSTENRKISPLHCAAINPSTNALSRLLIIEPNDNIADVDQNLLIHYAAASTSSKPVEFLIDRGLSIDVMNKCGESPLYIACQLGRASVADVLLKKLTEKEGKIHEEINEARIKENKKPKKMDLRATNIFSKKGYTPLQIAARKGHSKVAETLLRYQVNPEKKTKASMECKTALMFAAEQGHLETVKVLVEGGAKIEMQDRRKKSALIHAVMNGQTHVASYLLHQGADPKITDSSGNTLVHYAAAYGWWHCLLLVIEAGADPTLSNDWKYPPVAIAMMKNHEGIVHYLLDLPGIDIDYRDNQGKTLLMHSITSTLNSDMVKQIKFFLEEKKADANAVDLSKNNCLHLLACSRYSGENYEENIRTIGILLIKNGCDIYAVNESNFTPFYQAIKQNCSVLIELLLENNVLKKLDVESRTYGDNFLHFLISTYNGTTKYVEMFKRMINLLNADGQTKSKAILMKMCTQRNAYAETPLITLCKKIVFTTIRHPEPSSLNCDMLKVFLEDLKCDPNVVQIDEENGEDGQYSTLKSPLHILATFNTNVLDLLLSYKPSLNLYDKSGMTPLLYSMCQTCNFTTLVRAGADVNLWSKSSTGVNFTPLLKYASDQSLSMVKYLVESNATVTDKNPDTMKTVLHSLASNSSRTDELQDVTKMVLVAGAEVNAKDNFNRTPLHYAVLNYQAGTNSRTDLEELLLEYRADPHLKDDHQRFPMHYAFLHENGSSKNAADPIEMASMLVGAMNNRDVDAADSNGMNCLHLAASCGAAVTCNFFCRKMKNIDLVEKSGNTAICLAAMKEHESCTLMLLQNNADINVSCLRKDDQVQRQRSDSEWIHPIIHRKVAPKDFMEPLLQVILEREWQGALYTILLIIEELTGDFNDAIEAALMKMKYNLVLKLIRRSRKPAKLLAKQKHKQNFLHRLAIGAIFSFDENNERHLQIQVAEALIKKGVSLMDVDEFNATPIIYAAQNHNFTLCNYFSNQMKIGEPGTKYRDDPDIIGRTILSSVFWVKDDDSLNRYQNFGCWMWKMIKAGISINVLTSYPETADFLEFNYICFNHKKLDLVYPEDQMIKVPRITPLIYSIVTRSSRCTEFVLKYEPDLNMPCQLGLTPIMYAVIVNDVHTLKLLLNENHEKEYKEYLRQIRDNPSKTRPNSQCLSINRMVTGLRKVNVSVGDEMTEEDRHFKMKANVNLMKKDRNGKTVVHHLIHHYELGSFDNLRMLQLLMCVGYEATTQQWRKYLELADKVGAVKIARFLRVVVGDPEIKMVSCNFQVNDKIHWPHANKYSYEDDANSAVIAINPKYFEPDRSVEPNQNCNCSDRGEVVMDTEQKVLYSVKMHKFDIDYGVYGFYNFYMMQVVHNKAQDLYVLFTMWGRIGNSGQWQNTPCSSKEAAIQEFCKIFKAKSGNSWDNIHNFNMLPFKYHLVNTAKKKEVSVRDMDIDLTSNNLMPSKLPLHLKNFFHSASDVKMLKNGWRQHEIDSNVSPFGMLDKETILEGQQRLHDISVVIGKIKDLSEELKIQMDDGVISDNYKIKSYNLHREIEELSEEVYTLLPVLGYDESDDDDLLKPLLTDDAVKKMLELIEQLLEFDITSKLVLAAHHRIHEVHPMDYIYRCIGCKLELMNPKEKMSSYILQNILATSNVDVIGIYKLEQEGASERLQQLNMPNHRLLWHGTKLENILSILSRGLRISPTSAVRTGQAYGRGIYFSDRFDYSQRYTSSTKPRVMLLCEVALGKVNDGDSVLVHSYTVMDPKGDLTLLSPYGAVLPVGKNVAGRYNHNEYVIPDSRQVCIRYMVLFK